MPTSLRSGRSSRLVPHAGLLQICVAGVLWGTGGLAVQVIRDHADLSATTISAYRTTIAAIVLVVACVLTRQLAAVRRLLAARPGPTVFVGLATAAYQALYFASVVWVGVTVSTVVSLGVAPLALTIRDAVQRRRGPDLVEALTVFAALAGLVLVTGTAGLGETGPHPVLGVLAALASGSAYAIATAVGEPLARSTAPLVLTTAATSVGACGLVPVALLTGGPLTTSDPVALLTLLYLGALTFALAYALLYAGLRTTSSSAAVVATLCEPVTAAVAAAAFLGERLTALGVLGIVLVVAAIAGTARERHPVGAGPVADPDPGRPRVAG
ncbi:DMT family transporter [Nocardioides agariphilus]|uniref:DMT family transporter n=1 Tax=Nocardioides agariphilus TaxID=433664 RepID=A0A930VNS3_9ACTN|nr:DMT family transporter [Nocardioides agariphilus]MBF4768140.1 DMT family transporter [Nocardioides agariphilus]